MRAFPCATIGLSAAPRRRHFVFKMTSYLIWTDNMYRYWSSLTWALHSIWSITRYCFGVLRISLYFVELHWSSYLSGRFQQVVIDGATSDKFDDKLKINDDKSEFILIGTQAQSKKMDIDNLAVGDSCISPSTDAIRNLGAWFDANFTMSMHVTKTCKTGFFYLHNISRIRKFLAQGITENLIHGFDEPPQLL